MKIETHDFYTGIFLTKEEVLELCKPGEGADTCIWLVVGGRGFECIYYNRRGTTLTGESIEGRWKAGLTVAKRDGCEMVRNLTKERQM